VNAEQSLGSGLDVFGRAGLNNGQVESFAYTEVDRSLEVGMASTAPPW
jgi:high affinity Mn2+ porin